MLTPSAAPGAVAGQALSGPPRPSPIGDWWATPAGSALQVDPATLADGPAGLTVACAAVRALALPGVWPIVDLVDAAGTLWLLTAAPLHPTLDELLSSAASIEPMAAAGVLNEVGQTLVALRKAGWVHGAVDAGSVVLGPDGIARLADVAVRATAIDPDEPARPDADAWALLVERVGAAWGGSLGDLAAVAAAARVDGIGTALRGLGDAVRALPAAPDRRASLRAAVTGALIEPVASEPQVETAPRGDSGSTILGRKNRGESPSSSTTAAVEPGEIRFGPGVPTTAPLAAEAAPAAATRLAPSRRRRVVWAANLVVIALAAGVLWWWLHRSGGLAVSAVRTASSASTIGCDSAAELAATVTTNGDDGTIDYHWRRSDGTDSGLLHEAVTDGRRSVRLVLHWRVEGRGRFHGQATVEITGPSRHTASAAFDYACP